ncbi:MAG TPA: DUF6263 family protein [Bacteroidales bacterium]|jgi:hypothetical protein|nr:hypothetical protein [Bacteroidota bacterium]HJN06543.1 DUF6263 family protein [Bacteroidales bacterium]|tara:strand:+ start:769 stop:1614 length:846 start_codon:yes stop_codon:yes gene_type:complete
MKTKIRISLWTLIGLFLFSISGVFAQKSVELQYNLNKGDKYLFITDIDMDMTFDARGTTTTMNSVMGIQMTSLINNIDGKEITQEITIDRIKMNQQIFGMELNYDSGDSSTFTSGMGAQIGEQMNKIIGATVMIIMDNHGNYKEVDFGSITDNSDLIDNFGSGNSYAVYPEKKVKVGDSWETDIKPLEKSEMKVHVVYTLLKMTRKQAVIGVEGVLSGNEVEGQEINLSGTTTGEMIVDRKTGMLIQSTIDTEIALDLERGDVKIPATMMSTSETNVKKAN